MDCADIKTALDALLLEIFELDMSKFGEQEDDISLLDPKVGLYPRDLLMLFFDLEKKFNVKFNENDIVDNRFDSYQNLISILYEKQHNG